MVIWLYGYMVIWLYGYNIITNLVSTFHKFFVMISIFRKYFLRFQYRKWI